jgi:hypothetical protein
MKNGEDIKNALIDKFYNEDYDKGLLESNSDKEDQKEILKFEAKLELTKEQMDSTSDLDYNLDINIMDIISEAEEINNKKKNTWETLLFTITSLVIFSVFAALTLALGTSFIIYFQVAIVMLTPFMLIPICKAVITKGGKSL